MKAKNKKLCDHQEQMSEIFVSSTVCTLQD